VKTYWVLWTYSANYSELRRIEADSPEKAKDAATCLYGPDFHNKAMVYVFDRAPVLTMDKGTTIIHNPSGYLIGKF
jgi:hypothetical protein